MRTGLRLTIAAFGLAFFYVSIAMAQAQFNYAINNGAVAITGYYGPGGAVTIPSTITGLPVASIESNAL
jgi:nicotinamide mononucleotide (NMN) deamidase PncC